MEISVGLITSSKPNFHLLKENERHDVMDSFPHANLSGDEKLWRVVNLLIGNGFHWEEELSAVFQGKMGIDSESGFLINSIPLENYLCSVVGSEMNPDSPLEFLRAHAIVSRSWAAGKIFKSHPADDSGKICTDGVIIDWQDTADHTGFDVCSDDHCQRYQGLQPISDIGLEAIRSTDSLVIAGPSGNIVDARFSKCCGGRTELFSSCWQDEERECLESFADPWCDYSSLSPSEQHSLMNLVLKEYDQPTGTGFSWRTEIHKDHVRRNLLSKFGKDVGEILSLRPVKRGASGRIVRLRVDGSAGSVVIGKELAVRRLLSNTHLYSSAFSIERDGDLFILHGHGWGHGVGMCQTGAARMAAEGHTAEQILKFYYPGSRIVNINDMIVNDQQ